WAFALSASVAAFEFPDPFRGLGEPLLPGLGIGLLQVLVDLLVGIAEPQDHPRDAQGDDQRRPDDPGVVPAHNYLQDEEADQRDADDDPVERFDGVAAGTEGGQFGRSGRSSDLVASGYGMV